ncbi:MAG: DUF2851 family protein [Bacteroidota bacterium]|nr:DUF2851 family protein [Bacteroidota bacterium]
MNENFLQFIWQQQLFDKENLYSIDKKTIKIIHPGFLNTDSGPDFFNAKIKIGNQLWAGNIEIHVKSSDWNKHNHNIDSSYDNVILHVVSDFDLQIETTKGIKIPTLILKYNPVLYENYTKLIMNKGPIPCSDFFYEIDSFYIKSWQNRLLIERFERKTDEVLKSFRDNNNYWEETFYIFLAKNFGFKLNSLPFEMLAKSLPLKSILKQKDSLLQIEAMLFGQAGFLDDDCNDDYYKLLKREYLFLAKKFNLQKIDNNMWKYLRLRPVNFPTIRIAQFASVLHKNINLFSTIISSKNVKNIRKLFEVNTSNYWNNHYQFCKKSKKRIKTLGEKSIDGILINTVALFLFAYGEEKQKSEFKEKALELLEIIKSEKNSIIRKWETNNIIPENAFESQALLELYNEYCKKSKCLNCNIGSKIIIREKYL